MSTGWETVIGLEIHVQLATRTKLFCGDPAMFGAEPNTLVCPVCLGLPGALPVVNEHAVRLAVRAALGLGCTVHETSEFARKNYFYPDLPKGYQITQHEKPLATGGSLPAGGAEGGAGGDGGADGGECEVRIRRVHIEEDAGKSLHDRVAGRTAVDLNRAGVPLVEIVTEPDLRDPGAAREFLTRLKRILEYLEVSDCDMEKGSLRVDANVSVRRAGDPALGTPTELKNLNSFASLERALETEAARQEKVVRDGGAVERETLLWDADRQRLRRMRAKRDVADYRYFPEPDLPPLTIAAAMIEAERRSLPELPAARATRFVREYGLPPYDAGVLTSDRRLADYFETVAEAAGDPKGASNVVMNDVLARLKEAGGSITEFPVRPSELGALVRLMGDGTLSSTGGKAVLDRMIETGGDPAVIARSEGLVQVRDGEVLAEWVEGVLSEHPAEVRRYREGDHALLGFFMGRLMQRSGGSADPRRARALLRARLDGDDAAS